MCDASEALQDESLEGVLEDALFLRELLGEGELPLKDVLQAVDGSLPISLEIRSRALMEKFPKLQDRANVVFQSTQQFLSSVK